MDWLILERWSPYAVGIGIGILSWLSFLLLDKPIGCSTAFARSSGMFAKLLWRRKADQNEYYKMFAPVIDWEWMLVIGVLLGGFLSALMSGTFRLELMSGIWIQRFGDTGMIRMFVALLGGILMGFGARWAGGCTSGHGISGVLQMAVSGWIAAACFFISGILTALMIF
jgi:uncharacterized protein